MSEKERHELIGQHYARRLELLNIIKDLAFNCRLAAMSFDKFSRQLSMAASGDDCDKPLSKFFPAISPKTALEWSMELQDRKMELSQLECLLEIKQ